MNDDTEAARDWRAEDRAGAAAMPAPTKAEEAAILLALDAENADAEDPRCVATRTASELFLDGLRAGWPSVPIDDSGGVALSGPAGDQE